MKDAQSKPTNDQRLKLHWPEEHGKPAVVLVELWDSSGLAIASMSIPAEQLLQVTAQELDYQPLLSLGGCLSIISDKISLMLLKNQPIPLDQLVADAVSPEMLEDEPEAVQHLSQFRIRLFKSLEHVEKAIASLPKP
jgi:hypothetical protein